MDLKTILQEEYKGVEACPRKEAKVKTDKTFEKLLEVYLKWLRVSKGNWYPEERVFQIIEPLEQVSVMGKFLGLFKKQSAPSQEPIKYLEPKERLNMKEELRGINYGSPHITNFVLRINDELPGLVNSGYFISALINHLSKGSEKYFLGTEHLEKTIDYIGHRNRLADIIVKGKVGARAAGLMSGGSINIQGKAGYLPGEGMSGGKLGLDEAEWSVGCGMSGGEITAWKVGDRVGQGMKGGKIRVKESAGDEIGFCMKGGEIHLEGNYGTIARETIKKGIIYYKKEIVFAR